MRIVLPAVFAVSVGIVAAMALHAELSVVFGNGHSTSTRLDAFAKGPRGPGLATSSNRQMIEQCRTVMAKPDFAELEPADQADVRRGCESLAIVVLDRAPIDGAAWLLLADIALRQERGAAALAALERSHASAPEEGWIASRRLLISLALRDGLEGEALQRHRHDIAVLSRSLVGATFLARLYLQNDEFQDEIVEIVQAESPEAQRLFLIAVRALQTEAADREQNT